MPKWAGGRVEPGARHARWQAGRLLLLADIADDGTIVALKSIFLHSFRPSGERIVAPRQWAIDPSPALSTEPFNVDLTLNGRIVATENGLYST
jgi:hypothetical protein